MEILVYLKDLRDALVYTGTHLFRARERKDEIVGTIAEPRKDVLWRVVLRKRWENRWESYVLGRTRLVRLSETGKRVLNHGSPRVQNDQTRPSGFALGGSRY